MGTELVIQRLRWLQALVRNPTHHEMYWAAMFGRMGFESGDFNHREGGHTHPWVRQLRSDFERLATLEAAETVARIVLDNPMALVHDADLGEAFCFIDVRELRAKFLTVHIPPPGVAVAHHDLEEGLGILSVLGCVPKASCAESASQH